MPIKELDKSRQFFHCFRALLFYNITAALEKANKFKTPRVRYSKISGVGLTPVPNGS
jgi:hypothetical protein